MSAWTYFLIESYDSILEYEVYACRIELDSADTREELQEMLLWMKGKPRKEIIDYTQQRKWARGKQNNIDRSLCTSFLEGKFLS